MPPGKQPMTEQHDSKPPKRAVWAFFYRHGKQLLRTIDVYIAANSLVPTTPVLDPSSLPGLRILEERWLDIRLELAEVLRYRNAIPSFHDVSPDQYRISTGDQWKTFFLCGFGIRSDLAARLCPTTTRIVESIPGIQTAFFSILAPRTHIPRHTGVSKRLINCHLGLIVPKEREKCFLECGGVLCLWEEGKIITFDDTYPHEVHNNTAEERVVLMLQVDRPCRWQARILSDAAMWLIKRSAYVTKARRNQQQWEQRLQTYLDAVHPAA
jgi:beta-hydroxylase